MTTKPLLTISEVSQLLHINKQCLRQLIKQNKLPFAVAINLSGKRWTYKVFASRFYKWLGGADAKEFDMAKLPLV
jgi:Flp pilus assembly protein protease CpaA